MSNPIPNDIPPKNTDKVVFQDLAAAISMAKVPTSMSRESEVAPTLSLSLSALTVSGRRSRAVNTVDALPTPTGSTREYQHSFHPLFLVITKRTHRVCCPHSSDPNAGSC